MKGATRMKAVSCLVFLLLVLPVPLHPRNTPHPDENSVAALLGTWKLVSFVRQELPSGVASDVMGPHPAGYITYSQDGRMMVIITASDRKKPAGNVATPAEVEALTRGLVSYAGSYSVDVQAKTVTHHVDISWNEVYTGTDQTRNFELKGNRLSLTTVPSPDPVSGKMTVRTLIWERYLPK
jgi:lipocalin-like protein